MIMIVIINDNGSYLVMMVDCGSGVSSGTCNSVIIEEVTTPLIAVLQHIFERIS